MKTTKATVILILAGLAAGQASEAQTRRRTPPRARPPVTTPARETRENESEEETSDEVTSNERSENGRSTRSMPGAVGMPGMPFPGMPGGGMPGGYPLYPITPPVTLPDGTMLPPAVTSLLGWCDQTVQILSMAQMRAATLTAQGKPREATQALIAGMQSALGAASAQGRGMTMTGRTLIRGINYLREMLAQVPASDGMHQNSILQFAVEWALLTIRTSQGVDRNYFIPFMYYYQPRCGWNCDGDFEFDYGALLAAYHEWAGDQIKVVTERLSTVGGYPLTSPRFAFRTAERIVREIVFQDLSQNPRSFNYTCEISTLVNMLGMIQTSLLDPTDGTIQASYAHVMETLDHVATALQSSSESCQSANWHGRFRPWTR